MLNVNVEVKLNKKCSLWCNGCRSEASSPLEGRCCAECVQLQSLRAVRECWSVCSKETKDSQEAWSWQSMFV